MKTIKTILLAAALTLGVAAQAQQPTPTLSYTGDSLPTTQGWTELRLDTSVNPFAAPVTVEAANGALRFTSANGVDTFSQVGWYHRSPGLDLTKGYTVELKAKLSLAQKGSFNIQGYDNTGRGFRVSIAGDSLTNQSDPLKATSVVARGIASNGDFHTFRLAALPAGRVLVWCDQTLLGSFPLETFGFDNIVENGGFEDEFEEGEHPDFVSNSILQRILENPFAGESALLMDSDGKNNSTTPKEGVTTREYPLKPSTDYEFSMTRRRAISDDEWAWRDFGAYWETQAGSVRNQDVTNAEPRERWWNNCFENTNWVTGTETFNKGDDATKNTLRFEFPSWIRDDTKNTSRVAIDNLIFREKHDFSPVPSADSVAKIVTGVVFPEGYVNLIANGDFEDTTKNNDGSDYAWALASGDGKGAGDNFPVKLNELWGAHVRLQDVKKDVEKGEDTGDEWAHSGKNSLRISYLADENQGKTFENTTGTPQAWKQNINFKWPLEANKSYIFSFWIKTANYGDNGTVKIGKGSDELLWSKALNNSGANIKWTNYSITFSTAEALDTLKIFTEFTNWFNFYLDDIALYEVADATIADPQLVGKTNLIANGGFEDTTMNSDGSAYEWALASARLGETYTANYPVKLNELWGAHVRLQDTTKGDDTGIEWAHSGSKSLRVSYLASAEEARAYEGIPEDSTPQAWKQNINFEKVLEANKTYTFVFWIKTANYPDNGRVKIANGDLVLWEKVINQSDINWTRYSITFTTTALDHTLRMFTEFTGWCNFYLDDLFLYEEETYAPYQNENSYLFFGKSQNTASADVEVEYVKVYNSGAYTPDGSDLATISCNVTYHLNGGAGATDGVQLTLEAVTLPTPTRDGYTFAGWYENATFEGTPVTEIAQYATGSKEFWAKWDAVTYTITLHANDVPGVADSAISYTTEAAVALPTATTAAGYTVAWYGSDDLAGEGITEVPAGASGDKVYYAGKVVITYSITFDANGGSAVADGTYNIESDPSTGGLPTTEKTGYDFAGWYESSELEGAPVTEIPAGSTGDKVFYAKWDAIKYSITYILDGGALPDGADTTYTIEDAVTLPTPTKTGYPFEGWYTGQTFTGNAVTTIALGSTGNKTYYAKWGAATAVESLSASALRIYPNPVSGGLLTVEGLPGGSASVEVYSVSGALAGVYSVTGVQATVDISSLPAGTYIVKAAGKTAKVVKE